MMAEIIQGIEFGKESSVYFVRKLLEKTNTTMFDAKKLNRENPYYLALLKTILKSKDVVKTQWIRLRVLKPLVLILFPVC